jgi:hypothetical protein
MFKKKNNKIKKFCVLLCIIYCSKHDYMISMIIKKERKRTSVAFCCIYLLTPCIAFLFSSGHR